MFSKKFPCFQIHEESPKKPKCEKCNYWFKNRRFLKNHIKIVQQEKNGDDWCVDKLENFGSRWSLDQMIIEIWIFYGEQVWRRSFGSSVASAPLDSRSALRVPQGGFRSSCLALHTTRYTAQASQFAQSGLGFQYLFDLNYIFQGH